jgi:aminomethyltransferase
VIISNTGYTGSGGFEIYFKNESAEKLWDAVIEAGAEEGIIPCGLAARDTLRLKKDSAFTETISTILLLH